MDRNFPRRKGKNNQNKGSQGRQQQKPQKPQKPPMKFTIDSSVYVPKVQEPLVECAICHKPIENIIQAISEPEGGYSHFDCVLSKIASEHTLGPKQKVSYLGKGVFGIIETEEGKFTIIERINYETSEAFSGVKSFVESQKK